MPMHIVHSMSSSCSRCYNYLYSLSLCTELTNSVSVGLLCSQSPLGLLDLVTQHTFHNPCVSSFSCLVSSDIMKLPFAYTPLSRWWCGLGLIVTIGLDQRTCSYFRSGRVIIGMSDVFHGLHSRPHHLVILPANQVNSACPSIRG